MLQKPSNNDLLITSFRSSEIPVPADYRRHTACDWNFLSFHLSLCIKQLSSYVSPNGYSPLAFREGFTALSNLYGLASYEHDTLRLSKHLVRNMKM